MKLLVLACALMQFILINCKSLPEYFPDPCRKSDVNYKECVLKGINKLGPYLLKGIPEYKIPKMDPLSISSMVVNRTLNEFLTINAVLKDIEIRGMSSIYINDLKTDIDNMGGEIKVTIPSIYLTMEYNVLGQLLAIPLQSHGYFRGNFTDTVVHIRASLKLIEKEGVKYFALDKIKVKSRVGDGFVKLTSKNPRDQLAADLITNFFNENPRRTLDAVNPFYIETSKDFYSAILKDGLSKVPANELLPE